LEALKNEQTATELARRFGVYPTMIQQTMIQQWRKVRRASSYAQSNELPASTRSLSENPSPKNAVSPANNPAPVNNFDAVELRSVSADLK